MVFVPRRKSLTHNYKTCMNQTITQCEFPFSSLLAELEVCQGSTDTSDMVMECENEKIPVHALLLFLR